MHVCHKKCLAVLLICLTSSLSGCSWFDKNDSGFEWLDIQAVPRANTERVFQAGSTYGDLAGAYIDLKQECRATNVGINELQEAQNNIRRLK